ncbi:MAG: hypothetical protein Q8K26_01795 [Candidatus Gracilibacteria bacterium]|nr:hypothetical protein [Candidatus Gracilibacteria bacterium]
MADKFIENNDRDESKERKNRVECKKYIRSLITEKENENEQRVEYRENNDIRSKNKKQGLSPWLFFLEEKEKYARYYKGYTQGYILEKTEKIRKTIGETHSVGDPIEGEIKKREREIIGAFLEIKNGFPERKLGFFYNDFFLFLLGKNRKEWTKVQEKYNCQHSKHSTLYQASKREEKEGKNYIDKGKKKIHALKINL